MKYELEKQRLQIEMEREPLGARVEVEQAQIELSDKNQYVAANHQADTTFNLRDHRRY